MIVDNELFRSLPFVSCVTRQPEPEPEPELGTEPEPELEPEPVVELEVRERFATALDWPEVLGVSILCRTLAICHGKR